MKKVVSLLLCVFLLAMLLPVNRVLAESNEGIICFDDGSYLTITLEVSRTRELGSTSGTKYYSYYNSEGALEWQAALYGKFTYTGNGCACTEANCNVTIYNTVWYVISKTASRSENSAIGELTMGRKWLGITVDQVPVSLLLSCDVNGNLS